MLILFIVVIAAPLVIRRMNMNFNFNIMDLMQPLDSDNNDTASTYTGSHLPPGFHAGQVAGGTGGAAVTAAATTS